MSRASGRTNLLSPIHALTLLYVHCIKMSIDRHKIIVVKDHNKISKLFQLRWFGHPFRQSDGPRLHGFHRRSGGHVHHDPLLGGITVLVKPGDNLSVTGPYGLEILGSLGRFPVPRRFNALLGGLFLIGLTVRRTITQTYTTFTAPRIDPVREETVFKLFWVVPSPSSSTVTVIDTITNRLVAEDVALDAFTDDPSIE